MRPVHPEATVTEVRVGSHLRSARQGQGLTLQQVAESAGLTKGFLSRVERDETSPSVSTLARICQVLSVPVGDVFSEPDTTFVSLESAPRINMGGTGADERLVSARSESRVQVLHSTLEAGASGGNELYTINCEVEVVHVVAGEMTIHLPSGHVRCEAGDSFTMPGRHPHTWTAGEDGAVVLWVLVPAAWSGATS